MEDASAGIMLAEYQREIGGGKEADNRDDYRYNFAALVAHRRVCICETAATQPRIDNLQRELPGGDDDCHAESKGRPKLS
ncbi:hypothetical protein RU639_012625 [Aspergillus parasiticus]